MNLKKNQFNVGLLFIVSFVICNTVCGQDIKRNQYSFERIAIPAATADEPKLKKFSLEKATNYMEQANIAWSKKRKCVACHTNGTYLLMRPALTAHLGKPSTDIRVFFIKAGKKIAAKSEKQRMRGITPTQMAYIAGGLAEWDKHVAGKLSNETDVALKLMFELQGKDGSWGNTECWPPFESSSYQGTTVAAMAAATAPGWLVKQTDKKLLTKIESMKKYLRTTPPPHDYGRLLLLWTSTRFPDLIEKKQQKKLIRTLWKHQQKDGGWSIRTFAKPEAWGNGKRTQKLRNEPEFKNPPSDGHQTGLAILVLREAGISADDQRIAQGIKWLLDNQRQSGRWWTRSLNTDKYHFITYSGTCYPLLALAKCNALPKKSLKTAFK